MGGVDELVELLAPEVELCLGRTKWGVRWSHAVLLRLERETGKSVLKGEVSPFRADSRLLRVMVKVTCPWGVRWDRLTLRVAGKLLEGFGEAWLAAMPIPSPKRPSKSTDGSVGPEGGVEPDSWLEAWANAHQCLRLSGAEWLAFTPRMIQVLSEFRLEELRRQEWMSAQIAANVVNFGGMGTRTPAHARDFMLHPWPEMGGQTIEDVIWSCVQSGSLDPASKSSMMKLMMEPVPGVN